MPGTVPYIGYHGAHASAVVARENDSTQNLDMSFVHREFPPTLLRPLGLFNTMPADAINHDHSWKRDEAFGDYGTVCEVGSETRLLGEQ